MYNSGMTTIPLQVARAYFDAWNRHDAPGIVATFAENGTYTDPTTPAPLTGEAIGAYAEGLWSAFPDLSFEFENISVSDRGLVTAEWVMKGTNSGSMMGLPPTGLQVTLPGADFVRVEGDKIRSVQGYFDSAAVPRALGLDVIVQPKAMGPFGFGTSVRASTGNKSLPAAFSITCLEARTEEEVLAVRASSRKVATELLSKPGFISFVGVTVGDRMMTVTAWETADAMESTMKSGEHRAAVERFFSPEIARGGHTGIWAPLRLNKRWIRCQSCSKMIDATKSECGCGAKVPEPIAYW